MPNPIINRRIVASPAPGVGEYVVINGVLGRLLMGRDNQPLQGRDGQYLYGRA